jgi:HEPN domain-containing protein
MTPNEVQLSEARKWLREAAKALHSARLLLPSEDPEPSRSLFHSQQAAEKAAKAFLALRSTPFRKTHDLVQLGLQCGDLDSTLAPLLKEASDLADSASAFRYPDAPNEPDVEEAVRARALAEKVFAEIRVRVESTGSSAS